MRVLLIEDEPWLGQAVRDQIEKDGHPTDFVANLADARRHLSAATYDLILLDLLLPMAAALISCVNCARADRTCPSSS